MPTECIIQHADSDCWTSALNTCCSYCIVSVEDLPTADNCDSLKWNPAKAESWYVCAYCVIVSTNNSLLKELCMSAMLEF